MQCLQLWRERALNSARGGCTVKTVVISLHSTCKCAFQGLGAFVWSFIAQIIMPSLCFLSGKCKNAYFNSAFSHIFLIRLQLNCWSFCSDIWGLHSKAAGCFWGVCADSSLIPPCPLPPWPFSSELGLLETALLPKRGVLTPCLELLESPWWVLLLLWCLWCEVSPSEPPTVTLVSLLVRNRVSGQWQRQDAFVGEASGVFLKQVVNLILVLKWHFQKGFDESPLPRFCSFSMNCQKIRGKKFVQLMK